MKILATLIPIEMVMYSNVMLPYDDSTPPTAAARPPSGPISNGKDLPKSCGEIRKIHVW